MTPAFRIEADGADVTAAIADRLLSLAIEDGEGMEADTLEIVVDDRDGRVEEPATGAALAVALGYRGAPLTAMGRWTVNAVAGTGPLRQLTIRAEPADLAGPIRAPRTRAWEATTLGAIVEAIAARAGLRPFVAPALAGIAVRYEAQTAESDLHFLTRLAGRFDAIAKPAGGRLVLARRGDGEGPPLRVSRTEASDWRWERSVRSPYARVTARYDDPDRGAEGRVEAGRGEPVRELRRVHATRAEAEAAARAELARSGRGERRLDVSLARFRSDLFGGARVVLEDFGSSVDGPAEVASVGHRLDEAGLVTRLSAARVAP